MGYTRTPTCGSWSATRRNRLTSAAAVARRPVGCGATTIAEFKSIRDSRRWRASSRTRWRSKARSFRPNGTSASLVIPRRRATQHTRLLIREPDLHAIIGSQELVIADTRQQMELHQLNHHDSAAYGCDPRGTQLRTWPFGKSEFATSRSSGVRSRSGWRCPRRRRPSRTNTSTA